MNVPSLVHLVAAARPNFMKIAPLWHALSAEPDFTPVLVHTGQHYDSDMCDAILEDLRLPTPDHHLGVGSGTHAEQTGGVMIAYEKVAAAEAPNWVVVAGDVNSTAACALVAAKLHLPLVHLEAGLRSGDRRMPEEINRLVTDTLANVLWTPSPDADANLAAEGVAAERITRVGNIMLDSFEMVRPAIESDLLGLELRLPADYAVVTLHRPSNVDDPQRLRQLVGLLIELQQRLQIVFPVHPRTRARLEADGLDGLLACAGVLLLRPLPYIRFMSLVVASAGVVTDSGGVQEETTYLGIPCFTLRENTERPVTVTDGTNRLVTIENAARTFAATLAEPTALPPRPELWDGATAQRCVQDLRQRGEKRR